MPRPRGALRRARVLILAVIALSVLSPYGSVAADERVGGLPVAENATLAAVAPAVDMPSGVLRTLDGRTLWERDPDAERAMASTTKIMTALVVLDHASLDDIVTISGTADGVGESSANLAVGDRLTVQKLLEAMLVHSGNDAAFALAEHVGGDVETFVAMMNEKAAQLGLAHTAFANPHGLDEPGHYTSAGDLATLSSVAMADERFASIVALPSVEVSSAGRSMRYETSNLLIGTYPGATGIKTGWTDDAGYCLVASAARDGVGFVAVVLGTDTEDARFEQAKELLDWGFGHYAVTTVASAETTAALVPVTDYLDRTVTAVVAESVSVPVFDLDGEVTSSVEVISEVEAPVRAGDRLGTLTVTQGTRLLAQVPIVAADGVGDPGFWDAAGIWITRVWRTVFGGQLQADPVPVM